uniref:Uncharacterized protein n=1 Tax=Arundo donax TaxID=35708 RepID=A0A0A9CYX3_ARUDO
MTHHHVLPGSIAPSRSTASVGLKVRGPHTRVRSISSVGHPADPIRCMAIGSWQGACAVPFNVVTILLHCY